jgi:hypothetical protein
MSPLKIQHYAAIVSSCLLCLVISVVACSKISQAIDLIRSGSTAWEARSHIASALLSLGLAYYLWRWAGSVRKNARLSLQLKQRLDAGQERA